MTAHTRKPLPNEAMTACGGLALTSLRGWPSFANSTTDSSWMTEEGTREIEEGNQAEDPDQIEDDAPETYSTNNTGGSLPF
ncbi:hypothetical protein YTPLAS72_36320 [Nitrospira sp.]|nr:hypothetical protein YTPLAS72_36320 [Nitrospira sp.]